MSARPKHFWRLATAWTTVAALLFHVAILLTPYTAHSAAGLGNSIILCSSFGQSSVALADLDGDQVPAPLPEKNSVPAGSIFCPICAAAHLTGPAIPSTETILPLPSRSVEIVAVARDERVSALLRTTGSGPRAPPSII